MNPQETGKALAGCMIAVAFIWLGVLGVGGMWLFLKICGVIG